MNTVTRDVRDAAATISRRAAALIRLTDAYDGNTQQLLRDLGDHIGISLAYVDRDIITAHLERALSSIEWQAISNQFTALEFDEHIGDQGRFRTNWIEMVLERAGVPGHGYTADGQPIQNRTTTA